MTGTALNRGRMFHDFDNYKNEEWLRRRKLRIEQVRKQSKEIAKALRQKVENETKIRAQIFQKLEEAKFKCWRAEKLDEMERKLRCALEEFGLGHKLSEEEPCPNELIEAKNIINSQKAQERGQIAKHEDLMKKKKERAIKESPIHRKKVTRKIEDLRSALIRSISVQNQLLETGNDEKEFDKKIDSRMIASKKEKKIVTKSKMAMDGGFLKNSFMLDEPVLEKPNLCEPHKYISQKTVLPLEKTDTTWINLNEVQNSSGISEKNSQTITSNKISTRDKIKPVEFYDYHARYSSKTYGEYSNLVERIDKDIEKNGTEEFEMKERTKQLENENKLKVKLLTEERGQEALRKEKIRRDYNELIAKLNDLNKKEKLAKAYQPSSSAVLFMTDDRILEKSKAKQKIMNTKFESLYYSTTTEMPSEKPLTNFKHQAKEVIDDKCSDEKTLVKLSFSPVNLKCNTPVPLTQTESSTFSIETAPNKTVAPVKKKKRKVRNKLLLDIDRALNKGRKLRETIIYNWKESSEDEKNGIIKCDNKFDAKSSIENLKTSFETNDNKEKIGREVINKEAQTDNFSSPKTNFEKAGETKVEQVDFAMQAGYDTLLSNVSTSTSYKSPPSEISCASFQPFFNRLENLDEAEDYLHLKSNPKLRRKVEKMLRDLLCEIKFSESVFNPQLKYYIKKLLNMSRECVANLSIASSTQNSTINPTETDFQCSHESNKSENDFAFSEKSQAKSEETEICEIHMPCSKSVKNWQSILGRNLNGEKWSHQNNSDSPEEHGVKNAAEEKKKSFTDDFDSEASGKEYNSAAESEKEKTTKKNEIDNAPSDSKFHGNLDLISEKCSKRISELTDLLSKVRRDKEMLLESASERSGSVLSRHLRNLEKDELDITENNSVRKNLLRKNNFAFQKIDDFTPRCDSPLSFEKNNTLTSVPFSNLSGEEGDSSLVSSETFPDVMNELLDKKIITSPFKWSEGDFSKELDIPSDHHKKLTSIETVIGDFRRKISKIKSFSLSNADIMTSSSIYVDNKDDIKYIEQLSDIEQYNVIPPSQEIEKSNIYLQDCTPESMDLAFTNLGLNWAKSFFKKIEKTKAMSSSTYSDEKKFFE